MCLCIDSMKVKHCHTSVRKQHTSRVFQDRTWDGQAGALRRVETVQANSRMENSESVFEACVYFNLSFLDTCLVYEVGDIGSSQTVV